MNTRSNRHVGPSNASPTNGARIIVAEEENTIGHVVASLDGGSDLIVHVRQPGQGALPFARGVVHAIHALERAGGALAHAIILTGSSTTPDSRMSRELAARALVDHLARTGGGELELVGPVESASELGAELWSLVERLLPLSCGTVSLRVRFARTSRACAAKSTRSVIADPR